LVQRGAEKVALLARPPKFPTLRIRVGLKKAGARLAEKKNSTRQP